MALVQEHLAFVREIDGANNITSLAARSRDWKLVPGEDSQGLHVASRYLKNLRGSSSKTQGPHGNGHQIVVAGEVSKEVPL